MEAGLVIVIMDIGRLTNVKSGIEDVQIIYQPKLRDYLNYNYL